MTCDRCEELERLLGMRAQFPPSLGLSVIMQQMLGVLLKREIVPDESLFTAVWGHKPEHQQPGGNIVSVHIKKLRDKLEPSGIKISTLYGQGYFLTSENKQKLRALCEAA